MSGVNHGLAGLGDLFCSMKINEGAEDIVMLLRNFCCGGWEFLIEPEVLISTLTAAILIAFNFQCSIVLSTVRLCFAGMFRSVIIEVLSEICSYEHHIL